jgi:transposase
LPTLRETFGNVAKVIVLDNVSIHTDSQVAELLEAAGHIVRYLPPYSPDYNPIELTFGVLKAWIKRNYVYRRHHFGRSDFGGFLQAAVRESGCDGFAKKHFKHAAGGLYLLEEDFERARNELREL